MKKIEEQLRFYVESVMSEPKYKDHAIDWAFAAIDFAHSAGLIDASLSDSLHKEYHLID